MRSALENALLATLQQMEKIGPLKRHRGICGNLLPMWTEGVPAFWKNERTIESLRDQLFYAWPKFSGDVHYPVPHTDFVLVDGEEIDTESAEDAYGAGDDLWEGEYGENRQELLRFMIATLEAR